MTDSRKIYGNATSYLAFRSFCQPTTQELVLIDPRVIAPKMNRANNFIVEAFTVITIAMTGFVSLLVLSAVI
jgi:hypothetical protein